ncbi:MAG: crossover junction endodeoxyribonuclease RuvC [Ferruginibacter sp.]
MQNTPKIILGIDPGTVIMGYGIIKINGSEMKLVQMDVLKLSTQKDAYEKLEKIYRKVILLIEEFKPDGFAIEAPFFGKNVQSMLKLGRAQGVAIAAAMHCGLPVCEYSPKKIKQSITGNGNADKVQVNKMLQQLLSFSENPHYMDASDALAVAVCHHFQQNSSLPSAAKTINWKAFVAANPGRIK